MRARRAAGRLLVPALAVLALGASLGACGGDGGGYHLTAYFERTVGLYEGGDVQVMGMPAGTVDDIAIDGTLVRVEMTIDGDVPLPADVQATVGQTQLIGERSVVLFPPWSAELEAAGADRIADGAVIPRERTVTPVEPDEGLAAFDELARSLDAEVVEDLVADSADVLAGRGEQLGTTIDQAAALTTTLAQADQQLLDVAENLHVLAGSLRTRDEQLGRLVDTFSQATAVLAAEREGIRTFLSSLVELTDQGRGILDAYGEQLPGDIASATALVSVFERNTGSVDELIRSFPLLAEGLARAYQPSIDGLHLRANLNPTVQALLRVLTDSLGIMR